MATTNKGGHEVDLCSAVSVLTGEPSGKPLHAHAPQVGAPPDSLPAGRCSMPGCDAVCPAGCAWMRYGQRLCRGCYVEGLSGSSDDSDERFADEVEDDAFAVAMHAEHGRWF